MIGKGHNDALLIHDFELLKWIGANSFRTSHYPYAEAVVDYADRQGIVVIDETAAVGLNMGLAGFLVGVQGYTTFSAETINDETRDVHAQAIRELVARDKNHPSVVLWAIANEPESESEAAERYFKPLFDAPASAPPAGRAPAQRPSRPVLPPAHRCPAGSRGGCSAWLPAACGRAVDLLADRRVPARSHRGAGSPGHNQRTRRDWSRRGAGGVGPNQEQRRRHRDHPASLVDHQGAGQDPGAQDSHHCRPAERASRRVARLHQSGRQQPRRRPARVPGPGPWLASSNRHSSRSARSARTSRCCTRNRDLTAAIGGVGTGRLPPESRPAPPPLDRARLAA